jgi:oxygen-independent coproporphyrinogen-3 oxidase
MAGIYIHIPFCKKACHYCNFHFSTNHDALPKMVDAISREAYLRKAYLQEPVKTIYLGGGTPSLLNGSALQQIMDSLYKHYTIDPAAEITLEANPDDIAVERLSMWKKLGINRLSIGIQSFFDEDLIWMNRAHTATEAINGIKQAQDTGFDNLTIDLIYGSPGLSQERWTQNLQTAINLKVPHLSCYALTVEPKTALEKLIQKGSKEDVDPAAQAEHFNILLHMSAAAGYEQYEISNFALPGFRSKHNSSYWQGIPYIGLGPSAHSFNQVSRQWNIANNALYLSQLRQDILPFEEEILTNTQQLNEYLMTSLRTMEGCSLDTILTRWGYEAMMDISHTAQKFIDEGLMILQDQTLILTAQGKFLADGIAADLFREENQ